jgi:hypothetical protein
MSLVGDRPSLCLAFSKLLGPTVKKILFSQVDNAKDQKKSLLDDNHQESNLEATDDFLSYSLGGLTSAPTTKQANFEDSIPVVASTSAQSLDRVSTPDESDSLLVFK